MDRSKSRIFTFHSDDVSRTARAPGAEFVAVTGGYGRLRAVTGGYGRLRAVTGGLRAEQVSVG